MDNEYKKIDILAIGDIATDVFIKIKEAETECDNTGNQCKLCLNYGGKVPYESNETCHAVGNSSNVAISASRLGLKSALMTNIGSDNNSEECLYKLKEEKVDTNFIKQELGKPNNYHYVLWYKTERTILVKHEKYQYGWVKNRESEKYQPPTWVYLSSLGEDSLPFHSEIVEYLKRHETVKLAFQPGTFQIRLGQELLNDVYKRTDLFISNHEEAIKILQKEGESDLSISKATIPELLKMIYDLGPKIVVITDGKDGAYSYDGKDSLFMKTLPQIPIESTGAGDSFSAAFLAALILEKGISEALIWGSINAMSVVSYVGPHRGLLNKEQIEEYIKNAPADFKPVILI